MVININWPHCNWRVYTTGPWNCWSSTGHQATMGHAHVQSSSYKSRSLIVKWSVFPPFLLSFFIYFTLTAGKYLAIDVIPLSKWASFSFSCSIAACLLLAALTANQADLARSRPQSIEPATQLLITAHGNQRRKDPSIQQIDPRRRRRGGLRGRHRCRRRHPRPPHRCRPRRRCRRFRCRHVVEKLIVTSHSTAGCQRESLSSTVMTTRNASCWKISPVSNWTKSKQQQRKEI